MKRKKWTVTLLATLVLLGAGGYLLWRTGFFAAATSLEGIQRYIEAFSPYSQLVFLAVQLASVILAPIPSNITAAGGALLFGMWESFLLTWLAVTAGSMIVFGLSRALGQDFADRFVGQKVSSRYLDIIRRKQDVFLALVFLFPFFPDDLICILAGLTQIRWTRFLGIVLLFRPWGLLVASAVGSSVISIPLWGMALIGIAGAAFFLVGLKYGDQVEEALLRRFRRDQTPPPEAPPDKPAHQAGE